MYPKMSDSSSISTKNRFLYISSSSSIITIDQLLPRDTQRIDDGGANDGAPRKLRIDVARLSTMGGTQFEMLERFLRMIQVQRQDFNGKVITVRAHDTRAIAVMLDVPVDQVGDKLSELGLLFVPPAA